MKFSDGYWLTRNNVDAMFAREAYELSVDAERKSAEVLATTKVIADRGDTLNLPTFTVRISSPLEGVIRVEALHWSGTAEDPGFPLSSDAGVSPVTDITNEYLSYSSGDLKCTVKKGAPWNLSFSAHERVLTSSYGKSLVRFKLNALSPVSTQPVGDLGVCASGRAVDESEVFTSIQLDLGVGTTVYGFGERFEPYVKNGQSIDIWNSDGGTSSEQGYKDIPFYLTSDGYGVLVNNRGHVSFEVASENTDAVQFAVPGEKLDFCVIYGPTPKDILNRYTALVGRPANVPAWSYGLWLSTSFTTRYDEATVQSFIDGMSKRDVPLSTFHYDCFWMKEFQWTDFTWDARFFPDPTKTLQRWHDKGLHVCCWINPYIAQRSALFDEGADNGYLLRKPNGDIWQTDLWQAGMGIVDFTNPAAREWFKDHIKQLLKMGVDAIKTDFGERIPVQAQWFDGSQPASMHNWYTQLYNQAVFEAITETRGTGEAILYARSATVGGQQQPVHWGGDCESTFRGMAQTLRGGLSLVSSGFGFWSHDIGGFEGEKPDSAVYKRWIPFGLLGSHSRLHGSKVYRVPWLFDEEDEKNNVELVPGQTAVDVLRKFTKLKLELMPYLYHIGLQPHLNGTPVMRSLFMEFPDDPACRSLDRQYMFGPSLLVAPIFNYSGEASYYLPHGVWTNWFTGETVQGGVWRNEIHGFDSIPLWVRDGSIIVTHPGATRPDYVYGENAIVSAFLNDVETAEATVSEIDSSSVVFTARRTENGIEIKSSDGRPFKARLGGSGRVVEASRGAATL
ncbi:alpha-xylosidase [Bifidobacterium sp. UTBIF-78]|uniref:alpha-xylosidase n=1 Tax=Bifidobacterium sp. UTBIF-78 TaxID=1465263 RepID=UPI001125C2B1|nr:alpha-xylosidase [Bifidobacterium sp. UTBIF-78]TPF96027.1 alpha-glucosidase [Bifidobacterium sp. UTBIF-78]